MTNSFSSDMGQTMITQTGYGNPDKKNPEDINIKNLKGKLGPKCTYCDGLGFTNTLGGQSLACRRCDKTGIEPVDSHNLQEQIDTLSNKIDKILRLLQK